MSHAHPLRYPVRKLASQHSDIEVDVYGEAATSTSTKCSERRAWLIQNKAHARAQKIQYAISGCMALQPSFGGCSLAVHLTKCIVKYEGG